MFGITLITAGQLSPATKKIITNKICGPEMVMHNLKNIFQMFQKMYNISCAVWWKVFMRWYIYILIEWRQKSMRRVAAYFGIINTTSALNCQAFANAWHKYILWWHCIKTLLTEYIYCYNCAFGVHLCKLLFISTISVWLNEIYLPVLFLLALQLYRYYNSR